MRDDLIPADHPVVREALSRLTDKELFDRTFRIRRAAQLFISHEELQVNEQISFDNDRPYLWKHLMDICKDRDERSVLNKIGSENKLKEFLSLDSHKENKRDKKMGLEGEEMEKRKKQ